MVRQLQLGDVLIDGFQRTWTVDRFENNKAILIDPYGEFKDRPVFVPVGQAFWELFKFGWNSKCVEQLEGRER